MKVRHPGYIPFEDLPTYRYLYYPGAGLDASPIVNLAHRFDINVIVYVEYITEVNQLHLLVDRLEENNFTTNQQVNLPPEFLNPEINNWEAYWDENHEAQNYLNISSPWGKLIPLRTSENKSIFLVYLHTEAVRTYALLNKYWGPAQAVVIQDQGTANYWTPFGGNSEMYLGAQIGNNLPEFIYLDVHTACWPNYVQNGEFEECIDMFGNPGQKALYRRVKSN